MRLSKLSSEMKQQLDAFWLEIHLFPELGSQCDQHRLQLREILSQTLRDKMDEGILRTLTLEEQHGLKDLKNPPRLKDLGISLSHCALGSAMALDFEGPGVGLDLEEVHKIRPEIVARISSTDEIRKAPSPAALWVAKESAFKSFSSYPNVKLQSSMRIESWKYHHDSHWVFQAQTADITQKATGLVLPLENLILGICKISH